MWQWVNKIWWQGTLGYLPHRGTGWDNYRQNLISFQKGAVKNTTEITTTHLSCRFCLYLWISQKGKGSVLCISLRFFFPRHRLDSLTCTARKEMFIFYINIFCHRSYSSSSILKQSFLKCLKLCTGAMKNISAVYTTVVLRIRLNKGTKVLSPSLATVSGSTQP